MSAPGPSRPRGRFLTLEGVEGAGKSTNLAAVQRQLEAFLATMAGSQRPQLLVTREPGGTPFAEGLRELLLAVREEPVTPTTELLLMFAARSQHVENLIRPALERGDWVLSDRFTDASYAYQGGGRQLDRTFIERLEQEVVGALTPDLTIFLDLDWKQAFDRIRERSLDRFESEAQAFFDRVRSAYHARLKGDDRFICIDASAPLAEVEKRVETALAARLAHWDSGLHGP